MRSEFTWVEQLLGWRLYQYIWFNGPLLCKLVEKVDRTYYPEDLDMKAEINGNQYNIYNTSKLGCGNLTVNNINFYHNSDKLTIPITDNNESLQLVYSLNYSLSLQKYVEITIDGGDSNSGNSRTTKITTGLPIEVLYFFIIITTTGIIMSLVSYHIVKKIKTKKENFRKKMINKYMDVLNLEYIIVSDKKSGLSIYEQMITDKKISSALVSGFLQAIRAFGIELTGSDEQSRTIKLDYQKSKILMSDFKNYRIINIFEDNPSKEFETALEPLSQDIEKIYGERLENFDGEITQFKGIKELLEKHLCISLVYPLKINKSLGIKLQKIEKSIINQATSIMRKRNLDHFYVSHLMSQKEFDPKRAEIILNLINKKIFLPII